MTKTKKPLITVGLLVGVFSASAMVQAEQSQVGLSEGQVIAPPAQHSEAHLIKLESTFVGDKEQPSVSYFIPWKGTGAANGLRWQIERKNDDTLSLVDRDIMLRSINIYNEMNLE